uniref:DapH/DapD/GlmU-related protein n=1 Tax=Flavobacterium sp. Root935 TaxID=1736610 RepID=UPI0009E9A580|nr:DapH/DapD/GlmU-related protein [Flavobacterium sp. Root935]
MKKIIISGIANISLVLLPLKFSTKIKNAFNSIYTNRILKNLKDANNGNIRYPMYLTGGEYIKIGNNFDCDQRLRLDAIDNFLGEKFCPEIIIGNNVSIQKDCHIGAINKIILGDNVLLASKVYISDHSHGEITKEAILLPPSKRKLYSKGPVIIEDNVWLGENVVVLPGVTIGENTVVGANAVVTKSIPKNSVVGGNPARVIREL